MQDHIVCSYGYNLICVDERYSKPHKTEIGGDTIDQFLNDMIKETGYCSTVVKSEFNKPLGMSEKCHEDFNNSTKFLVCKRAYEEGEVNIKDHNQITGSTHQECNLNLILSKKIPIVFYNLQNYDSHLIFPEIGKYNFNINIIPKTIKNIRVLLFNNLLRKAKAFICIYR